MRTGIHRIRLAGFTSIRDLDLGCQSINVLIGENGAGKSNLLNFLDLLTALTGQKLQDRVMKAGGAAAMLFDGPNHTSEIDASLRVLSPGCRLEYEVKLALSAGDRLGIAEERFRWAPRPLDYSVNMLWQDLAAPWKALGKGQFESGLSEAIASGSDEAKEFRDFLMSIESYHFNTTGPRAPIRHRSDTHDTVRLHSEGGNLAAFLLTLKDHHEAHYDRIVATVKQAIPFFSDFVLKPDGPGILLRWTEIDTDAVFGAHQASDGMLRFMALATLLLQPAERLPPVIVLDEPEIGLHPVAVGILAGLIRSAAQDSQIFVATQSPALVDEFEPEDVVVVDRKDRESRFERPDSEKLAIWLERYSLADVWLKNIIGGQPF